MKNLKKFIMLNMLDVGIVMIQNLKDSKNIKKWRKNWI